MSIKTEYLGFLNSSPLWRDTTPFEFSLFDFDGLLTIEISSSILKLEMHKNEVLGKRIEHFFDYYLKSSDRYSVLAKSIQIFKNKTTIGELDFLIRDHKKQEVLHVELVYKFYLYDPLIVNELDRWVGPNNNDTLVRKIEKLQSKQLPLLYREETKPVLDNLGLIASDIHQKIGFMTNLFIPLSMKNEIFPLVNNSCIVGFWLKEISFIEELYGSFMFALPIKKDWIVTPENCNVWMSFRDIKSQVQKLHTEKKSPLVWMKKTENSYERFFIVWW